MAVTATYIAVVITANARLTVTEARKSVDNFAIPVIATPKKKIAPAESLLP